MYYKLSPCESAYLIIARLFDASEIAGFILADAASSLFSLDVSRCDLSNRIWTSESRRWKNSGLGSMLYDGSISVGTALSLIIAAMIVAGAGLQLAHRLPDSK